jgi:hypothetical protein
VDAAAAGALPRYIINVYESLMLEKKAAAHIRTKPAPLHCIVFALRQLMRNGIYASFGVRCGLGFV